jgi:hypothetical protein
LGHQLDVTIKLAASLRVGLNFRVSWSQTWHRINLVLPPWPSDLAILTFVVFSLCPGGST